MTNWWLDEVAHAGQEHLDAAYVAGYEAKAQYDPTPDLAVLARHGFCATSAIVDLGAGTGRFSVQAAAICAHVTAVDVSPAMIDVIRRRTADLDNVTVVQAASSATTTPAPRPSSYSPETPSWLFEPMLERVGFEILDKEYVRNAYGAYTLRKR
ncbi:MAG: class I SAM-dependent methyltransferase [Ilumatobacteraceae bacterium]